MENDTLTIRTAFMVVIASILSALLIGWLIIGVGMVSSETPNKFYTFLSVIIGQGFMLVPLFWFLKSRNEPITNRLRLHPVSKNTLLSTIYFSIGLTVFSDELDRIIQMIIPQPEYINELSSTLQPETVTGFVLLFMAIVIIAPIGEELLFRGFLQKFLEKHWQDVTRAILVTSLFFAIIHMNSYWLIQIYILGIFLGYLSWKTNSVIPSLILHSINNGTAMLFSFTDINIGIIYLWHDHVAPWIIVISSFLVVHGFRGINHSIKK